MPAEVQIIAGPARSGKTRHLLQLYRRQLQGGITEPFAGPFSGGECFWLAPNQSAVAQLQNSLLDTPSAALLRPNLCTFAQFAQTLITRSGRPFRPISQLQKRRLLRQAIQATRDRGGLEHFARVASTPGFVAQVDELIAELKRKDLWPEAFDERSRIDRRIGELSQIYAAYQQRLGESELYDTEGTFWAAREILTATESTAAATTATEKPHHRFELIVVSGFNDFTTSQYDILGLLSKSSSQLLISMTVEQPSSETWREGEQSALVFAKTSRAMARLRVALPQLKIETLVASRPAPDSLGQLQHQLFRDTRQSSDSEGQFDDVEIVAAPSALGEIEAIAEKIKALLQAGRAQPLSSQAKPNQAKPSQPQSIQPQPSQPQSIQPRSTQPQPLQPQRIEPRPVQPQEIVVVCQGGERMVNMIHAVFPDYGIPYWSELRPRLESEPLLRSLAALLKLHHEDWPFQTLLEVINNRLLRRFDRQLDMATSFAMQPRVAMEYCVRDYQLPSGKQHLLEQLEYRRTATVQGETDQRAGQVAIALDELRQLDQLLAALPGEATIGQWTAALEALLAQLGALTLPTTPDLRTASAWHLLRRGLRSIAQVDSWSLATEQLLSLWELQELIGLVAREQRRPARHDAVGRVRVLSAESARKLPVEHLFLAGLSETAFSSAAPVESSPAADDSPSLFADVPEMAGYAAAGGEPIDANLHDANLHCGDGMLLFYELVTRATASLTLSYPALDAKGQSLPPSPLLTELQRSVGENRVPLRKLAMGAGGNRATLPLGRGSFRRQAVDQALAGNPRWLAGMISQPDYVRVAGAILSGIECVAERGMRETFGPYEGLILSEAAQAALAERFNAQHLWSPSQLESYATCPFRFFSEHLLKLEPLGELALRGDARRRGSLLHQVLATIHQQLSEVVTGPGSDIDAVDLAARFLAALNAAVQATPLRGIEQSLREIERREIEAWAPSYAEQESHYRSQWNHWDHPPRPTYFEVRFGSDSRHRAGDMSDPASTSVPFELDLGSEQIRLTGQIDRVDVGRVGEVIVFNIIDYKSGKEVKLKLDQVRSGYQLQLPLYALAAEQLLLADQRAVALATGYWNIQGKGFESAKGGSLHLRELADQTLKTTADWQQLQPDLLRRVQELINGVRGGQFPVFNEDEQCTRSCSLSTVCQVAQIRSLEKVWPPTNDQKDATGQNDATAPRAKSPANRQRSSDGE